MSQENVEAVRRSLDGWNRGDFDAWAEGAHPEIEWSSEVARQLEGPETVYRGPAGMRRYWDEWHALWDVTIDVTDIRDLGETVLAVGITRTRGEASGIDLETPVAYIFEFDGSLARKAWAYLDPARALAAVGLKE